MPYAEDSLPFADLNYSLDAFMASLYSPTCKQRLVGKGLKQISEEKTELSQWFCRFWVWKFKEGKQRNTGTICYLYWGFFVFLYFLFSVCTWHTGLCWFLLHLLGSITIIPFAFAHSLHHCLSHSSHNVNSRVLLSYRDRLSLEVYTVLLCYYIYIYIFFLGGGDTDTLKLLYLLYINY